MADLKVPEKRFRPEIEGVRAVAALLVAIYHIWLGSVSGGVDVFFIVSGYLITTSLLSRIERHGRINFTENLLGLAKRLFPVAFTVLFFMTIASFFVLPQARWTATIAELFSSAFYFQNWQLATNAVDYLAQNNAASPFQHFWALSIQGQFYVTWPIVITIVYFIAKKVLKTPVRKTLLGVLSIIFLSSLAYSVYITAVNQPWAYFDTFARAWEFSLGGIFALLLPYLKFSKGVSLVIGWIGLAIISLTGILLPVSTVFPGFAALLPTGGVILVLIAAENSSRFGVDKLLGSKPFQYFGSISYGFYLWHWPLLVTYYAYFETDTVTLPAGLSILAVTFILSIVSINVIEAPIRNLNIKKSKWKVSGVLAAIMLPVLLAGSSWGLYVQKIQANVASISVEDYPGARALYDNVQPAEGKEPMPPAIQAKEHLPEFYSYEECTSPGKTTEARICSFGVTENPEYTIALVGGSHSGHWFPALKGMAEELKLQIDVVYKDACRFTTQDFDGLLTEACMEWNDNIMEPLMENPPDLLFTTANVNSEDYVPEGYLEKWAMFEGVTTVFAVRDNPRMAEDPLVCLEVNPNECSVTRDEALSAVVPWENTANLPDNVVFADLSDYFCYEDVCPPVIGNVLVYRDEHHLTTMYSETLSPVLKDYIVAALENL